jgi:hypothetical protein
VTGGGSMAIPNEISKQYEKFVLEFVNAKTSDEIFLKVLTNTAAIFNFSAQFKEDLKEIYPSRNDYLSLSKIEKRLFLLPRLFVSILLSLRWPYMGLLRH